MEKRYQIFISSTFSDLEEERKEVMEAIINLDCFPAGMEMFPAADMEQFEYIKTIIDQSDYYVLVIAGRYGSLADDGKSYTEKEYEYAKEKGIPVLVFVKKDIEDIPSSKTDGNLELKAKLIEFRNKAMQNRLAKHWNDKMELKYNVHDSLSKAFKLSPRKGWIKGGTVTDIETLKTLQEVREENIKLQKENDLLKREINKNEEMENICSGEDKVIINYTYINKSYDYDEDFYEHCGNTSVSWNELLGLIGPSLIVETNVSKSKEIVDKSIRRYTGGDYEYFRVDEDDFNTIKLQFDALNLIECAPRKTVNGDMDEFLKLTEYGKMVLQKIKLRTKDNNNN